MCGHRVCECVGGCKDQKEKLCNENIERSVEPRALS